MSTQFEEVAKHSEGAAEVPIVGDGGVSTNFAEADPADRSMKDQAAVTLSERVEKLRKVLEPEPLRASFRVRSGVSVVVIIVLTALGFGVFNSFRILRPFIPHTTIVLSLYGLALYFFRPNKARKDISEMEVLRFYKRPRYWSLIILASAALIFTLCSALLVVEQQKPSVVEKEKPIVEPVMELPPAPKTVVFPALTVTGVVLNGEKSSAIINGDTVHLGKRIEGVKLVAVVSEGVVVELEDSQKAFPLESASSHLVIKVRGNRALSPKR